MYYSPFCVDCWLADECHNKTAYNYFAEVFVWY